ncbi:MAG TPA: macro domain-containing protein [Gemmatimonadales bacterium]|jgi:O-acetyl-ADP-ribose deacetylase (regulator of RNase III)|nr:macro domain-containing protein [Gemmatimonadales bacterium]
MAMPTAGSAPGQLDRAVVLRALVVDITTLAVDAIVNAANRFLIPGGGVCGAIHRAAGPGLALACEGLGGCPVGEARLTEGFGLPARFVIHAVGPVWQGGEAGEEELLASAYRSALLLANERGCRRIAFPAISTGIFAFPVGRATRIAVATARETLVRAPSLDEVIFACFSPEVLAAYREEGVTA